MSANDPQVTNYVRDKSSRIMAVFALRRIRSLIDRGAADDAAIRTFTIRALLWCAVVFFSLPLLMFCLGALVTYFEYETQG